MIYPNDIETKIGFDKIKELIGEYCLGNGGMSLVEEMHFSNNFKIIEGELKRVEEFRQIIFNENSFPRNGYYDLRENIGVLRTLGTVLSLEELFDFSISYQTIGRLSAFFNDQRKIKYPLLAADSLLINFDGDILREVQRIIDEKGNIRDNASIELAEIRSSLRKLTNSVRNKIYETLRMAKSMGYTRDDAEVTFRNGRVVIPINASQKRSIKGFVHDESATGQTVYLEPIELFENNNRIKELENEEQTEIKRIIARFSDFIRPSIEDIIASYFVLAGFDFVQAKAEFSMQHGGTLPSIVEYPIINWKSAVHPLLKISHTKKKQEVVPLDIEMNDLGKMVVLSGPNAGGKSVVLKNIALNQYMLQSGVLPFLRSISVAGIFEDIFIDIGDEQSIENDLSTYSSHLRNINFFVRNSGPNSLVLIDEFGSGTEPELGGAIARASMIEFYHKKVFALVTTHFTQLKLLADEYEGILNGSMQFDVENLEPLYKFKQGQPGGSFAFEIATKMGLPTNLLESAKEIVGHKRINFDIQLQKLETEKEEVESKLAQIQVLDNLLSESVDKYNSLLANLESRKQEILHEARREAKQIISEANKTVENTISQIRKSQAEPEVVKTLRKDLESKKKENESELEKIATKQAAAKKGEKVEHRGGDEIVLLKGEVKEGSHVCIEGQNAIGIVEAIKRNQAIVNFNSVKISVDLRRLNLVKPPKNTGRGSSADRFKGILSEINQRVSNFSPNVDLRGKRAEEVIKFLDKWLDEALLTGNKSLEILHGKGDGILRSVIRDHLSGNKNVASMKDAALELGGAGKTLISLR